MIIATAQVTVAATATLIAAERAGRGKATVVNGGTVDVFLGNAGVTALTGVLLAGVKGQTLSFDTEAAIYGVVGTGTEAVSVSEEY